MSPFYRTELICVIAWDVTGGADRQIWVVSHHARPAAASSAAVVWWQVETHPASAPNEVLWSGWVGLPWKHIPTHFILYEAVLLENKHQSITECFWISNLKRFLFFSLQHLTVFISLYLIVDALCLWTWWPGGQSYTMGKAPPTGLERAQQQAGLLPCGNNNRDA